MRRRYYEQLTICVAHSSTARGRQFLTRAFRAQLLLREMSAKLMIPVVNELMFTLANVAAHFQHKSFDFSALFWNATLRRFSASVSPKIRCRLRSEDDGKGDISH